MRRAVAPLSVAACLFASSWAQAAVRVEVAPIFGPDTPYGEQWSECAVRIENPDGRPARGTLELTSSVSYRPERELVVRAPFAVGAGNAAVVAMPTHGLATGGTLSLRVLDERGTELERQNVASAARVGPFVVDVEEVSRVGAALRGVSVPLDYENGHGSWATTYPLTVGQPKWDPATGDPMLPERAAGWSAATLVLARSDRVVKLTGPELDALAGYVLAGGTLALVVTRPEDLRHATVAALAGGEARAATPDTGVLYDPGVESPAPAPEPPPGYADPDDEEDAPVPPPAPGTPGGPKIVRGAARPLAAVASKLVGYAGGNLRASAWGATATYGLGEVHLLAFDPTEAPGTDDPWVQGRMVQLVRHAWDRRAPIVFPQGAGLEGPESSGFAVERQLDPNQGARWAVIFAAIALLAYAALAGPLNFSSAAKKGKPLRALVRLPLWSAGMFVTIVGMGVMAKGLRGRARHLTLVEAGAGMQRAAARRFRGFFTPNGRTLTIRTTDAGSVIDLPGDRRDPREALVVDRDGARLENVAALPWQTVTVREDGFATIGAGVSIVATSDGDTAVTNRIGRDLRAVVVAVPGKSPAYFARLADGATVRASTGAPISVVGATGYANKTPVRHLDLGTSGAKLDRDVAGIADAWRAIGTAAGQYVDWFPSDAPVVLAQIEGGEGGTSDASLRLESDRALLRVVGWGGLP